VINLENVADTIKIIRKNTLLQREAKKTKTDTNNTQVGIRLDCSPEEMI